VQNRISRNNYSRSLQFNAFKVSGNPTRCNHCNNVSVIFKDSENIIATTALKVAVFDLLDVVSLLAFPQETPANICIKVKVN